MARVRAQLRRARGFVDTQEPLRHGDVELDPEARRVSVDGREVELTRREFDLLAALLRDPDRVHTREGLLEQVWGVGGSAELISALLIEPDAPGATVVDLCLRAGLRHD